MSTYGLIAGSNFYGLNVFAEAKAKVISTIYGTVEVFVTDKWVYLPRHGYDPNQYCPPHKLNYEANLNAFKELGIEEVVGVYSTGSLRPSLTPGSLVIPDDWIDLYGITSSMNENRHITPKLSQKVREKLAAAAWKNELDFHNSGIYWQTRGPRLETKAEIKFMSNFADLVGMTMAGEAIVAQEMDLEFAPLCSVDNYANGLGRPGLEYDDILKAAQNRANDILKILADY